MRRWLWAGFAGWLAFGSVMVGSVSIGVPLWLRGLLGVRTPVEAIGERMFRALPPETFALLVNLLENVGRHYPGVTHLAKTSALLAANGVVFVMGALGMGVVRRWAYQSRWKAAAGLLVGSWLLWWMFLLPIAGAGLFGTGLGSAPAVAVSLGAGSLVYAGLVAAALPRPSHAIATGGLSRRQVLRDGLRMVLTLVAGSALGLWLERTVAWAQSVFERIRGLPPEVTPNSEFYTVSKNFFDPDVDVRTWRLEISGLVERPYRLSLEELRSLPSYSRPHTFECISNPVGGDLIGNAVWRGVRFRELVEKARPRPNARKVVFWCADGYHTAVPLVDVLDPESFLAYEMNGETLPKRHGFPVRAVIPGLFGMKNPKWITKLELTDKDHLGYWEQQGWSDEAVVKTMSKFATPLDGATLPAGPVGVGGVAYAGDRGIAAVEVSFDEGRTWQIATLKPPMGKHTWVLWGLVWQAKPGRYVLKVRARDGVGTLQDGRNRPPLPDGATGYHTIRVTVR